jgi:GNAT superfamily N-acetyltransferase
MDFFFPALSIRPKVLFLIKNRLMQIDIRKARLTDRDQIAQFQVEMAWETEDYKLDGNTVLKGVETVLNNERLGIYYVAVVGNDVVGSLLTTYEWSDWRNGTVLWIQSVFVDARFRKLGIYGHLYSYIKAIVEADKSLKGIRLYVDESNKGAREVYTRLGMNGEHYRVFEWMKD